MSKKQKIELEENGDETHLSSDLDNYNQTQSSTECDSDDSDSWLESQDMNEEYELNDQVTLVQALEDRDFYTFSLLLESRTYKDGSSSDGNRVGPLAYSCIKGYKEQVKLLIEKGYDIESRSGSLGYTPLMWSCAHYRNDVAALLIENGCNIEARSVYRVNTFMLSCANGNYEVFSMLLGKSDLNAKSDIGLTALMMASECGNTKMVSELIKNGCDMDLESKYRSTALSIACEAKRFDIVYLLIKSRCNVNVKIRALTPILLWVAGVEIKALHPGMNRIDLIYLLLKYGCKLDEIDADLYDKYTKYIDIIFSDIFRDFVAKKNEELQKVMFTFLCITNYHCNNNGLVFPREILKIIFDLADLKILNLDNVLRESKHWTMTFNG